MKKFLLKTGLLTIGSFSIFSKEMKLVKAQTIHLVDVLDISNIIDNNEHPNDQMIRKYSDVYQIDYRIVVKKIRKLTRDYSSYEWSHYAVLNGVKYDSCEQAILITVRDIYKNPENYGLTSKELQLDFEHVPKESCEDLVMKYCDVLKVNKNIAISIVYAECGPYLESYNYQNNHNPAGMGPSNKYKNIEHGISEFIFMLRNGYDCKIDSNSSFFYRIGSTYCPPNPEKWANSTQTFFNDVEENYYYYYNKREGKSKTLTLKN